MITEDTSINELLVLYIVSTLGFTVFYYLNRMFFPGIMRSIFGDKCLYFTMSDKSQREYCTRNVADLHSLIAAPLSIYVMFFACDDSSKSVYSSN